MNSEVDYEELIVSRDKPPNKPECDQKEYSVIKLKNGLTALIISDVENLINIDEIITDNDEQNNEISETNEEEGNQQNEKLAACSLTVGGAGSFNDFEEIPGLAHFVEHMLMMGSEKYPEENDYNTFIGKTGGNYNATTKYEHVTHYFDCPEIHLHEALKLFSSFFVSPLMRRESMTREREAIESEFQSHFSSDTCRAQQIFSTTATPENPVSKFTWGNLKTLQENISDDELYEAVHKFWKQYYVANRMTVAIQARLPTKQLEKWIVECFSDIQFNFDDLNELPKDNLFNMEIFNKIYMIQPVRNMIELNMTWVLPPLNYKSKPLSYASFLIGHEGEGSLTSYFQKKLWGLNLMAGNRGSGLEKNSMYTTFTIEIDLTDDGLKNYEKVIKVIFSYIKLLQKTGPVEWIVREIQTALKTCFQFSQEMSSFDYVKYLSQKMQRFPSTDYLTGNELVFEYNPDDIMNVLNALTPDSVNIMLLSKTMSDEEGLELIEPWFNTKYKIKDIKDDLIKEWESSEIEPELFLPKPNSYLTTDFTMLPKISDEEEPPQKLIYDDSIEVWYKLVTKFKRPVAYIHFYLISPIATATPKNSAMMDLLVSLFRRNIQEEVYPATVGSISYTVNPSFSGISITVDGFNQKLHLFLNRILIRLTDFKKDATEGLFNIVKQNLLRLYINYCKDPDVLEPDLRIKLLVDPFWTNIDKLNVFKDITFKDLLDYNDKFFKNMYVKCLIQGNVSENEAYDIIKDFRATLNYEPIRPGTLPELKMIELPRGEYYLRVSALNEKDQKCNITNYYQTTKNEYIEESSKIELLMLMMTEPLFDVLRTQEQLAYDVSCSFRETFNMLGWVISVKSQADRFKVDYVDERITEFLKYFMTKLKEMTITEFNDYKNALIRTKQQVDTHTYHEVNRNWVEIIANDYYFNKHLKQTEYIKTLTPDDIYKHFVNSLSLNNTDEEICLRKLSVQVDAEPTEKDDEQPIETMEDNTLENEIDHDDQNNEINDDDNEILEIIFQNPENTEKEFITDIQEFRINLPYHKIKIYNENW